MATEAEREAIVDRRVMRRLATDAAYRNAANADEQAEREDEITREELERFDLETTEAPALTAQALVCELVGVMGRGALVALEGALYDAASSAFDGPEPWRRRRAAELRDLAGYASRCVQAGAGVAV